MCHYKHYQDTRAGFHALVAICLCGVVKRSPHDRWSRGFTCPISKTALNMNTNVHRCAIQATEAYDIHNPIRTIASPRLVVQSGMKKVCEMIQGARLISMDTRYAQATITSYRGTLEPRQAVFTRPTSIKQVLG